MRTRPLLALALALLAAAAPRAVAAKKPLDCWRALGKLKKPISLTRRLLRRSPETAALLKNMTGFSSTAFIPVNKAVAAGLANLTNFDKALAGAIFNRTKSVRKVISRVEPGVAAKLFAAHTLVAAAGALALPPAAAALGLYPTEAGTMVIFREAGSSAFAVTVFGVAGAAETRATVLSGPVACGNGGMLYAVDAVLVPPAALPRSPSSRALPAAAAAAAASALPADDAVLAQAMGPASSLTSLAAREALCFTPAMWVPPSTCTFASWRRLSANVIAAVVPGVDPFDQDLSYNCPIARGWCRWGARVRGKWGRRPHTHRLAPPHGGRAPAKRRSFCPPPSPRIPRPPPPPAARKALPPNVGPRSTPSDSIADFKTMLANKFLGTRTPSPWPRVEVMKVKTDIEWLSRYVQPVANTYFPDPICEQFVYRLGTTFQVRRLAGRARSCVARVARARLAATASLGRLLLRSFEQVVICLGFAAHVAGPRHGGCSKGPTRAP
jgi:hypothetical protein